jgi:hypothetical protein
MGSEMVVGTQVLDAGSQHHLAVGHFAVSHGSGLLVKKSTRSSRFGPLN